MIVKTGHAMRQASTVDMNRDQAPTAKRRKLTPSLPVRRV